MIAAGRAAVVAAALVAVVAGAVAPVAAHHVGAYTPRDNELSASFKQAKFAIQAGKYDVALRLFDTGALRREMRAQRATLPAGLEAATRAALQAGDGAAAERGLVVLLASQVRNLAREADHQLADPVVGLEARAATGRRFLEAIWRYYNLIDFAVTQRDAGAATTVRLAFDEAEGRLKGTAAPAAINPCAGGRPRQSPAAADPDGARAPLRRIADALVRVIDASSEHTRRHP